MSQELDCTGARQAIQDRLDGPLGVELDAALRGHLDRCAECREYEKGLLLVRQALRSLPAVPMSTGDLEAVWSRTVDAGHDRRRWGFDWRIAAAAVLILGTGLLFTWLGRRGPTPPAPSEAEIARAADEARLVFALTAQAMRRTERAADQVLAGEVSPAVRRVPIRWPDAPLAEPRRSGT